jgi:hypothetical protein
MKKLIPVSVAVLVVGALGFYLVGQRANAPTTPAQNTLETTVTLPESNPQNTGDASTILGSIEEAMGIGKKLSCTYADPTIPGQTTTVYVEGKKMRFTSTTPEGIVVNGLYDGDTQYTWMNTPDKQGFKMDASCLNDMKAMAATLPTTESTPKPADTLETLRALKNIQCTGSADADFTLPKDVVFVDQCAMMKDSLKMMETMKGQMPGNMTTPTKP